MNPQPATTVGTAGRVVATARRLAGRTILTAATRAGAVVLAGTLATTGLAQAAAAQQDATLTVALAEARGARAAEVARWDRVVSADVDRLTGAAVRYAAMRRAEALDAAREAVRTADAVVVTGSATPDVPPETLAPLGEAVASLAALIDATPTPAVDPVVASAVPDPTAAAPAPSSSATGPVSSGAPVDVRVDVPASPPFDLSLDAVRRRRRLSTRPPPTCRATPRRPRCCVRSTSR